MGPTLQVVLAGRERVPLPAVKLLVGPVLVALKKPKVAPATRVPTAATDTRAPAAMASRFLLDCFFSEEVIFGCFSLLNFSGGGWFELLCCGLRTSTYRLVTSVPRSGGAGDAGTGAFFDKGRRRSWRVRRLSGELEQPPGEQP